MGVTSLKCEKYAYAPLNKIILHFFWNIYVMKSVISIVDLNMWLRNDNRIILTIFYS